MRLLNSSWTPGLEQKEILGAASRLEDIITELQRRQAPEADTILLRTRNLYDRTQRSLLSQEANPAVQAGLIELQYRLEDILREPNHPELTNFLLDHRTVGAQNQMSNLAMPVKSFKHIPFSYVQARGEETSEVVQALKAHRLPVNPDNRYRVEPLTSTQTLDNLLLIGVPEAHEYATGVGVRVGVIDTGCDYKHPEIAECFEENKGYNFLNETNDPLDDHKHGTHVAGTIAGAEVGVAPDATLYALKVLDARGNGSEVNVIRAMEWAIDQDLDVLNASLGSGRASDALHAITKLVKEKGIYFTAAAGNNGTPSYSYPASCEGAISVAAVDNHKQRAPFSQYNDQVTLSAPGVGVRSCVPGGGYAAFSGTSMASPHVAGAAALIREDYSYEDAEESCIESAEHLGDKNKYGWGLVRPDIALQYLHGEKTP